MMRRRVFVSLLAVATGGHAQWFFGNLYEAIVILPGFAASAAAEDEGETLFVTYSRPSGRVFALGSPVRYYVPLALPLALLATLAALITGWRSERALRGRLLGVAILSVGGHLLTAYIVVRINRALFFDPRSRSAGQVAVLKRRWVRLNNLRLGLAGSALALLGALLVAVARGPQAGPGPGR